MSAAPATPAVAGKVRITAPEVQVHELARLLFSGSLRHWLAGEISGVHLDWALTDDQSGFHVWDL